MVQNGISTISHSIEDLFYFLREEKPRKIDYSALSDLVLEGVDFIKVEVEKLKNGDIADGNTSILQDRIKSFLSDLQIDNSSSNVLMEKKPVDNEKQQYYLSKDKAKITESKYKNAFKATIHFEEGCEMENIRAYTIIHNICDIADEFFHIPENLIDDDSSVGIIRQGGFRLFIKTDSSYEEVHEFLMQTLFLKELELVQIDNSEYEQLCGAKQEIADKNTPVPDRLLGEHSEGSRETHSVSSQQNIISVNMTKLDKLMDLVGEMVIAEDMVIQNPDLKGMELENFQKAARQLQKITSEIQDIVMSIRMVPLSATFLKMHRIVRDMSKKLGKEVELKIIGEETEVDKNVIEHISDPIMHLVRNAIDHGIETPEDRLAKNKPETGIITLEAKNAGNDVLIIIKDDGRGLNKEKILQKARKNGLLFKDEEELPDKEIYNMIFLPGFSTKENVTEFSGRGVGMDVVVKNIETIGGSVSVDSTPDKGSTVTLKIPLTLAIIDGMNIRVGSSFYTIPTISIRESFRPKENDVFSDPNGNEMIMVRGQCYPILRIHELLKVNTSVTDFTDGIITIVEQDERTVCIFSDELIGQQQVVVKALRR
jgi:two-component system chemotaxis sensor kinase CheA